MEPIDLLLKNLESSDEEVRRGAVSALAGFPFSKVKDSALLALGDESWRVRKEAVDLILSVSPGDELARELVLLLTSHGNAGLRNSVVEVLQTVGERALPHLVEQLSHEDAGVRKFIVDIMGGIKSSSILPQLATALGDSDSNVAAAAAESMGAIGDAAAVPHLLSSLKRDDLLIRYAILEALVKIGTPVPIETITPLAGDPILKKALFECLGVIGDLASVPILIEGIIDRARNVREAALAALDIIRQRCSREDFMRSSSARLASLKGSESVEYLISMAGSSDLKIQRAAITILGLVGDLRSLDLLVKACRSENTIQSALDALRNLVIESGSSLQVMFINSDEEERCIIAYISGELSFAKGREIASDALRDSSPMVRAIAAEAVGKSGLTELIPALVKLLGDDHSEVRKRSTTALVRLATVARDSVAESAVTLAESADPDCRLQAVKLFGALKDAGHLVFLSKDEDYLVRRESITAIGELKNPETAGRLSMALADEEADVRLAAANALGWSGFADDTGSLALALDDSSQRVQVAAIKSLGRRGEAPFFERVAELAASASGMLKISALQSIVQIDPAKSTPFLERALKDHDEEVVSVAANLLAAISERR
ncbi:MAG: HEAT repeat domain-containing protein [Geobacteraceae bacterium]|nr:HEAT repeat domain-containing protein [Geobacteraceae bacterium]